MVFATKPMRGAKSTPEQKSASALKALAPPAGQPPPSCRNKTTAGARALAVEEPAADGVLDPGHRQYLAVAVVAARSTGTVGTRCRPTFSTACELRCVPAVCRLAGTQAHLRHFSLWNSHKFERLELKLEAVQRRPHGFWLFGLRHFLRSKGCSPTGLQSVPVAVRMGGKGEEDVLSQILCQVYLLQSVQFYLARKIRNPDWVFKTLQTGHAVDSKGGFQPAGGKEAAVAEADVQRVVQWRHRDGLRIIYVQHGGGLGAFEMLSFGWDLQGVYFHDGRLIHSGAQRTGGLGR